ncbi:MAG: efflux RND transporter permease subunit [Brotaphodocola sp.]
MGITKTVLKRPVTTVMVVLCLIVFGLQSVMTSKLELTPDINMPMLLVSTIYPGASAEDINDLVTKEIEDEIGSLSGITEVDSQSMDNVSIVMIQYDYDKDIDEAYDDLKKKIDALGADLPDDCETPIIMELNMDDQPVVSMAVNHKTQTNLYDYVDNDIVPEFEKISSVAEVNVSGGQESYIKIQLIPERMQQYHLTMDSVVSAIAAADFAYPAGDTDVGQQNLSVSVETTYDTEELLREIPINLGNGNTIYLEDVANVGSTQKQKDGIARFNNAETISLEVKKEQSSTAIDVSESVHQVIDELMAEDPDLEIVVVNDTSDNIRSSLQSVAQTIIIAIVLSMLIIFLFYGEFRASMIVGTSIPLSVLFALILVKAMGFSLNVITMSSLTLGVGMMVDNSIVILDGCLEQLRKSKQKGVDKYRDAALNSAAVLGQSVLGSTITTCVVFLPLALLSGMSGQLFKPLGFTIVFCMVGSLISALTIVPLCFVSYHPQEKTDYVGNRVIEKLQNQYRVLIRKLLQKKALVMIFTAVLMAATLFLATKTRMDLMASTDEGQIALSIEMRPGLKIEEMEKILAQVEEIVSSDEDVESYLATYGGSGVSLTTGTIVDMNAYLKDDRKRSTDEVIKEWEPIMDAIVGTNISMESSSSTAISSSSTDMEFILQSTDYDELKEASDAIVKELSLRPEVTKVHSTLENAAPVVKVDVDAVKANAENIMPIQVATTVSGMIDGVEATTLDVDGTEIEVNVEYADDEYDTIDKLSGIVLTNNSGNSVALTDVADIYYKDSPAAIARKDKQYQVTITGNFYTDDEKEQSVLEQKLYDEVVTKHMKAGITRDKNMRDTKMAEEFAALGGAIATAVFLIFVVMSAQFESVKFSVMVMTTIPLALFGSFLMLIVTDVAISMPSLLGFLMLSGTVVNNGIIYVDAVNQNKMTMSRTDALVEAGATRLRSILMTTMTTVISMVPMALAYGDSGELMQGLAVVDIGGLIASTVFAMLLLPVYYSVMSPEKKKELHYD